MFLDGSRSQVKLSSLILVSLYISLYPLSKQAFLEKTHFCCRGFDFDYGCGIVWNRAVGTVTITISRSWLNLRRTKIQGHLVWDGCGMGISWAFTGDNWRKNSIFQHFLAHLILIYFDVNVLVMVTSSLCYCVVLIQPQGESRVRSSGQTNSAMQLYSIQFKEYNLEILNHNYTHTQCINDFHLC